LRNVQIDQPGRGGPDGGTTGRDVFLTLAFGAANLASAEEAGADENTAAGNNDGVVRILALNLGADGDAAGQDFLYRAKIPIVEDRRADRPAAGGDDLKTLIFAHRVERHPTGIDDEVAFEMDNCALGDAGYINDAAAVDRVGDRHAPAETTRSPAKNSLATAVPPESTSISWLASKSRPELMAPDDTTTRLEEPVFAIGHAPRFIAAA
jgi:hypothetical protein